MVESLKNFGHNTYSFQAITRYVILVAHYRNCLVRDAIQVSQEGGKLLLSSTVCHFYLMVEFLFSFSAED